MKQLRDVLNKILNLFTGVSFLAMVVLTCWQVITRYIFKQPSAWSEELVSYLFAWMALLGASLVVGERGHMNIPVIVERMKPSMQKFFAIFGEVTACLFSLVILVYGGYRITNLAMGQMTSSLGVPIGIFYIILPLSGVLNIVYTILNIYDINKGNIRILPVDETEKVLEQTRKEI